MTSPYELLPCPFCGGKASCFPYEVGSGGQHTSPYYAGCKKCGFVFAYEEADEAIAAWNTRACLAEAGRGAEAVAWYVNDYGITWREGCEPKSITFPSVHRPTKAHPEPPNVVMRLYLHPPAAPAAGMVSVPREPNDHWAEEFCERVNWHPDGGQHSFAADGPHSITFRELAKNYIAAMLAAAQEAKPATERK